MILAIMQPYLFPYVGYFQTIKTANKYVIYDDVQFIKGGWINRNNILVGGRKTLFTISLADASANKLINEIEIKDDFVKFLKTLSMAYSKAPYRESVYELMCKICEYPDRNLARFAGNSIQEIANYLNLQTEFIYSSSLKKDTSLRAQDKVLAICEELGADTYINAIGGQELYNKEAFKARSINLKFVKTTPFEYHQFGGEFIPHLSIIDILMFNSVEETHDILNKFELI